MRHTTWILVTDSAKARLFTRDGKQTKAIGDFVHPASRQHPGHYLSEAEGRRGTGGTGTGDRPGLSASTNPKETEAEVFAREHAHRLKHGLDAHLYDDLVLVAPPHFLGLLRKVLDPQVARRITVAVDSDFAELDTQDLMGRLKALA